MAQDPYEFIPKDVKYQTFETFRVFRPIVKLQSNKESRNSYWKFKWPEKPLALRIVPLPGFTTMHEIRHKKVNIFLLKVT